MTPTPEEARALAERLTGYTPGPWRILYERGSSHLRSADNTSLMCDETYYPWVPETEGDWEIIAAAPDLHAALTAMVDEVERLEAGIKSRDHALNFILSDAAWTPKHPACESIIKRISSLRKGDGQ